LLESATTPSVTRRTVGSSPNHELNSLRQSGSTRSTTFRQRGLVEFEHHRDRWCGASAVDGVGAVRLELLALDHTQLSAFDRLVRCLLETATSLAAEAFEAPDESTGEEPQPDVTMPGTTTSPAAATRARHPRDGNIIGVCGCRTRNQALAYEWNHESSSTIASGASFEITFRTTAHELEDSGP
jgi:hypothetical protein